MLSHFARIRFLNVVLSLVLLSLTACQLVNPAPTQAPALSSPYTDAAAVMAGICFESANDAAEQLFILRSEAELIEFFDLADNSQLCRWPVARGTFDFSGGRVLVGIWNRGMGCTARHEVLNFARDDANRQIIMDTQLIIEGDCPYELVRPFWIGIAQAVDYEIMLTIDR